MYEDLKSGVAGCWGESMLETKSRTPEDFVEVGFDT